MCLYDFDITNVESTRFVSKYELKKLLQRPLAIVRKVLEIAEFVMTATFAEILTTLKFFAIGGVVRC